MTKRLLVLALALLTFVSIFAASGYQVLWSKNIAETDSNVTMYKHVKTGALVIYFKNQDPEKVFDITFRSPTMEHTGVTHILEHTVLMGSKKFNVRDPFGTMGKQSLNTYMNAMTSQDYTTYPIASKNDKDFFNLMEVYLDSVFYPNILKTDMPLRQEGWRYDLNSPEGEITINGVVYNEMKANFSSLSTVRYNTIKNVLFPDTTYKFVSGGDPDYIPNLTYQHYLDVYKKFYSPTNSLIYLYGEMDIEKALNFIDKDYLSQFNKSNAVVKNTAQKPFAQKKYVEKAYSIAKNADPKNKTDISYSFVTGRMGDRELAFGMDLLVELLIGDSSSPLRMALEEANLGSNVYGSSPWAYQPYVYFGVEGSNPESRDTFIKIVNEVLAKYAVEDFDPALVDAVFNSYVFSTKDGKNAKQKGLSVASTVRLGWIYANDTELLLEPGKALSSIKAKIKDGYFKNLIKKYFLNNNHSAIVTLKPVPGLDEEKAAALKKKLADYKASLSPEQIQKMVKDTKEFQAWQVKEDDPKEVAKLPQLSLEDISIKVESIPTLEDKTADIKTLYHNVYSNNIAYINMYFDLTKVPVDKIQYAQFLLSILGNISTEKYSYDQLSQQLGLWTGGINFSSTAFTKFMDDKTYYPKAQVSIATLDENLAITLDLLDQIINTSKFDEKDRMKTLVKIKQNGLRNSVLSTSAYTFARTRVRAYALESGKFLDTTTGLPYVDFVTNLLNTFDTSYDDLVKNLKEVKDILFTKGNLVVSYTGDQAGYNNFKNEFAKFSAKINAKEVPSVPFVFNNTYKNEAFTIASKVSYAVQGGDFIPDGFKYSGKMRVLENIVGNEFLWGEIREKGGAYGAYFYTYDTGLVLMFSYRDPSVKPSLEAYTKIADFLKNFEATPEDMKNFIIGAYGSNEPNYGVRDKANTGDTMYFRGLTDADNMRIKQELLSTTAQDIKAYADFIEKLIKQNKICTIGNEAKINEAASYFGEIKQAVK